MLKHLKQQQSYRLFLIMALSFISTQSFAQVFKPVAQNVNTTFHPTIVDAGASIRSNLNTARFSQMPFALPHNLINKPSAGFVDLTGSGLASIGIDPSQIKGKGSVGIVPSQELTPPQKTEIISHAVNVQGRKEAHNFHVKNGVIVLEEIAIKAKVAKENVATKPIIVVSDLRNEDVSEATLKKAGRLNMILAGGDFNDALNDDIIIK